jgi:hypothetical protein
MARSLDRAPYLRVLADRGEELYDNDLEPFQMENLARESRSKNLLLSLRPRMKTILAEASDAFLLESA